MSRRNGRWGVAATSALTILLAGPSDTAGQAPPPLPKCNWFVNASHPVGTSVGGTRATMLDVGPAMMIMLEAPRNEGGGTILVSGLSGPGLYEIGGPQNGAGFGSTLMIGVPAQSGPAVTLAAGDASPVMFEGQQIGTMPGAVQLNVMAMGPNAISGEITGNLANMNELAKVPPHVELVPVHISFTAVPTSTAMPIQPCT